MRFIRPRVVKLAVIAVAFALTPAHAQQPAQLTLAEIERMALQNNPTLAQAEAAIRAAQGRRRQAGLFPNPIVGYQGEEFAFRAFSEKSVHSFFVEQAIPLGGKLSKSRRVFEQEVAQAETESAAQKQRVLNTIRILYYEALGAERRVELRAELSRIAREAIKTTSELLPAGPMGLAKIVDVWGYNGSMPGPTIEVNEGDRVRIMFHNNLPEDTTIHWHGLEVPVEMDGTPYISQPMVKPGGMYLYEFTLNQNGTFFYHSHGAMQEMMGQIGLFIIHPRKPHSPAVHKDFGLILQEWAILPNNTVPNTMAMEFNWLTINGKSAPATTPMIVKQGERVRIRLVNLGMDHHPMHIHGHQFYVTGTEADRRRAVLIDHREGGRWKSRRPRRCSGQRETARAAFH